MLALSFHVDYWDRLGWTDPFGSKAYTKRQNVYARAFRSRRIYTPQMIVNGRTEFVGSSRRKARTAIEKALGVAARATVTLKLDGKKVGYTVEGAPTGAVLNVAVVEDRLTSEVPRGENAGRTLAHANVVRWFKTISLAKESSGSVEVEPPKTAGRVVAYVQDAKTMAVSGAAQLSLKKS